MPFGKTTAELFTGVGKTLSAVSLGLQGKDPSSLFEDDKVEINQQIKIAEMQFKAGDRKGGADRMVAIGALTPEMGDRISQGSGIRQAALTPGQPNLAGGVQAGVSPEGAPTAGVDGALQTADAVNPTLVPSKAVVTTNSFTGQEKFTYEPPVDQLIANEVKKVTATETAKASVKAITQPEADAQKITAGIKEDDVKLQIEKNRGMMAFFQQIESIMTFKEGQAEDIRETFGPIAKKFGFDDAADVALFYMFSAALSTDKGILAGLQNKKFARTAAVPGSVGQAVLRTVPFLSGSKQGIAALSRLIAPSFPTKFTTKAITNQLMVQTFDDVYRFSIAQERGDVLTEAGFDTDAEGKFIIPDEIPQDQLSKLRNLIANIELTEVEQQVSDVLKKKLLETKAAPTEEEMIERGTVSAIKLLPPKEREKQLNELTEEQFNELSPEALRAYIGK